MGISPAFRRAILLRVDVAADDVVARLRQAGADHEADVAGTHYRDLHQRLIRRSG